MPPATKNHVHRLRDPTGLYQDLPLSLDDKIRLVDLHPGGPDTEIQITLEVVYTDSKPAYEALSYTWGSSSRGYFITANGKYKVPVTNNLFQALNGLRYLHQKRTIWVDALCINQNNALEKGEQVRKMGRIYEEAPRVIIWLGQSIAPSNIFSTNWFNFAGWFYPNDRNKQPQSFHGTISNQNREMEDALSRTKPIWSTRVWTIQETMLANELLLCYANNSILLPREIDRAATSNRLRGYPHLRRFMSALISRLEIVRVAPSPREWKGLTFLDAVDLVRDVQATDRRDFVFSMYGIIGRREASMLEANYEAPCSQVFTNATFASIKGSETFEILCVVALDTVRTDDLPSWSVDFAHLPKRPLISPIRKPVDIPLSFEYFSKVSFDTLSQKLELPVRRLDVVQRTILLGTNGQAHITAAQLDELEQHTNTAVRLALKTLRRHEGDFPWLEGAYRLLHFQHSLLCGCKSINGHHDSEPVVSLAKSSPGIMSSDQNNANETCSLRVCEAFKQWSLSLYPQQCKNDLAASNGLLPDPLNVSKFWSYSVAVAAAATVFTTRLGLVGIGPSQMSEGDEIALIYGNWPFMIRRGTRFRGFAYIHGFTTEDYWSRQNLTLLPDTFTLR